jgi:hypothetical protein
MGPAVFSAVGILFFSKANQQPGSDFEVILKRITCGSCTKETPFVQNDEKPEVC